ncbi:MAG: SMC-Scp complex subunit ScpB [bacterium]|jgi:segregation and condensation protein B
MEELKRIVEALLFASPDPLSVRRIKSVVPGLETDQVLETLSELKQDYEGDSRSFQIVEIGGGYQLTTKPDYALWVGKLVEARGKQRLSRAALETLAIVAYKQPALRATLEGIRGVNVDGVLRTLMERDLVRIVGRADGPGRPLLFGTTRDFLMQFGLNKLADLPGIEEIEELVGKAPETPEEDFPEDEEITGAYDEGENDKEAGAAEAPATETGETSQPAVDSDTEEHPAEDAVPDLMEPPAEEEPFMEEEIPGLEETPRVKEVPPADGTPEADAEQTETE